MTLGEKITALRKQQGWSQDELAERLDVSRQSVSKWEGGLAAPEIEKLLRLSEVFSVSCDYLMKDEMILPATIRFLSRSTGNTDRILGYR